MALSFKKFLRFKVLLWVVAIGVALWLCTMPLIMNAWASRYWQQIDCVNVDGLRFHYEVAGKFYGSSRQNFWQVPSGDERKIVMETKINDKCWVNPSDPRSAVFRLDAPQHLGQGTGRFVSATMVLGVALLLTFGGRARRKREQARAGERSYENRHFDGRGICIAQSG